MPTQGLPWDDPDSDPVGDFQAFFDWGRSPAARKAYYEAERRRMKEAWILAHRLYCFAEITECITEDGDCETRCTGCHESMLEILAKSAPKPIRGLRPQKVIYDEIASLPTYPAPDPDLVGLCLEHPWLFNH